MNSRLVVDRVTSRHWDALLRGFDSSSFYQVWEYGQIYGEGLFRSVSRAVLYDGDRALAMAQLQVKRLPVMGAGVADVHWGPGWRTEDLIERPEALGDFLDGLRKEYCQNRGLCIRLEPRSTGVTEVDRVQSEVLEHHGFTRSPASRPYKTILLDLAHDLPTLRRRLDGKWRNQLNVAERASLTMESGDSPELFDRFHAIYTRMWASKRFATGVRVPLIRELQRRLANSRTLLVQVAVDDGRDVGAAVCAAVGDTMLYYLGATHPDLRRHCRPGYLLQWANICKAKEMGLRWYDTGGIPDDAQEVTRFKRGMNGTEVVYPGRYEANESGNSGRLFRLAEHSLHGIRHVLTSH
jgi:lipid II:glycine glycyltransferase (peptidoglycan interpeptide bridge formation enzyme)